MKRSALRTMTSARQLEVALLLYDHGPLSARDLRATGTLLAYMERRGLLAPVTNTDYLPTTWMLTAAGRRETLRCRRLHRDRLNPGR